LLPIQAELKSCGFRTEAILLNLLGDPFTDDTLTSESLVLRVDKKNGWSKARALAPSMIFSNIDFHDNGINPVKGKSPGSALRRHPAPGSV
jgi:hypothetical protein